MKQLEIGEFKFDENVRLVEFLKLLKDHRIQHSTSYDSWDGHTDVYIEIEPSRYDRPTKDWVANFMSTKSDAKLDYIEYKRLNELDIWIECIAYKRSFWKGGSLIYV